MRPASLRLQIRSGGVTYAVEMGPVWNVGAPGRGVVCEGPVGARVLGRSRAFRYEVRCWPGGSIPDLGEAASEPLRVTEDPTQAAAALALLPQVPPPTWGRDELGTDDMWNSNSLVARVLARSGHDMDGITPPPNGRAPGWVAGLRLAERQGEPALGTRPARATASSCGLRGPFAPAPPAETADRVGRQEGMRQ